MFQNVDVCVEPASNFAYPGLHHHTVPTSHSEMVCYWLQSVVNRLGHLLQSPRTSKALDSWRARCSEARGGSRPCRSTSLLVTFHRVWKEHKEVSWCFSGWAGNNHVFKKREPSLPAPLRQMSHNLLLLLSLFYLKLTLSDVKEMLHIWNTLEVNYNTYFLLCLCRETSMCCHSECR